LGEKIASSLFIRIDNSYFTNRNIIQDNKVANRVVLPSSSLVLVDRITMIIPNEIQANCTIKGEPLGKIVC